MVSGLLSFRLFCLFFLLQLLLRLVVISWSIFFSTSVLICVYILELWLLSIKREIFHKSCYGIRSKSTLNLHLSSISFLRFHGRKTVPSIDASSNTISSSSKNDAQLNPYSLHHSYGPANVLATHSLIGAENYYSWSRAMLMALSEKNKAGFIDGSIKKPILPSTAWKFNNDIIASGIFNSVTKEIAANIIYKGSVKDVWEELQGRFKHSNGSQIYQLHKDLVNNTQGNMSIELYYTKIKTIWQDLVDYRPLIDGSCDGLNGFLDHLESEYVMIFLMGLNES